MLAQESRKNGENRGEKFAKLYPMFVAGNKWLSDRKESGLATRKDALDFCDNVAYPLHELYKAFTADERKTIYAVMRVYDKCGGKSIRFRHVMSKVKAA